MQIFRSENGCFLKNPHAQDIDQVGQDGVHPADDAEFQELDDDFFVFVIKGFDFLQNSPLAISFRCHTVFVCIWLVWSP